MDFRELEIFLTVMETGSVRRAAERVHLTPGAISQRLQNLAEELKTELFRRQGRGLAPTPAAERLRERGQEIVALMRAAAQEFPGAPRLDNRPFHFASGPTTLIHRLGPPLRALRARYPRTHFHVMVAPTEEIIAELLDGRCDLGLISLPVSEDRIDVIPLYEEEMLFLRPAPRKHAGGRTRDLPLSVLSKARFLLYPQGSNMRREIERFLQSLNVAYEVTMEADDTEAIKRLVEAGFGYSVLPGFALRGHTHHFEVFRISGHRLVRRQALAMAKSRFPRALTLSIAAFLRQELVGQQQPA
jgi:DNA-binding transcriptional LysR family regulator